MVHCELLSIYNEKVHGSQYIVNNRKVTMNEVHGSQYIVKNRAGTMKDVHCEK